MPGAWLDEWPPGLMLDHILEQVSLCCPWGSLVSLWYQMQKSLKVRWVQSRAHVAGFELSYWFLLLFWAVSPLSGVTKPWMDPILI